jgi:hypothetical protein
VRDHRRATRALPGDTTTASMEVVEERWHAGIEGLGAMACKRRGVEVRRRVSVKGAEVCAVPSISTNSDQMRLLVEGWLRLAVSTGDVGGKGFGGLESHSSIHDHGSRSRTLSHGCRSRTLAARRGRGRKEDGGAATRQRRQRRRRRSGGLGSRSSSGGCTMRDKGG